MKRVPLAARNGDGLLQAGGWATGVHGPSGPGARCRDDATGDRLLAGGAAASAVRAVA